MNNLRQLLIGLGCAGIAACASSPVEQGGTLSELERLPPDVEDIQVADGLERAAASYRRYLEETSRKCENA